MQRCGFIMLYQPVKQPVIIELKMKRIGYIVSQLIRYRKAILTEKLSQRITLLPVKLVWFALTFHHQDNYTDKEVRKFEEDSGFGSLVLKIAIILEDFNYVVIFMIFLILYLVYLKKISDTDLYMSSL